MLSRKDYEALARIIKSEKRVEFFNAPEKTATYQEAVTDITERITGWLASDNPNFDDQKFLEACTPDFEYKLKLKELRQ